MANSLTRPYLARTFERHAAPVSPDLSWPMTLILGVFAGALAVLVFQEGTLQILHLYDGRNPLLATLFGETPAPYRLEGDLLGLPHLATETIWGAMMALPLAIYLCRGPRVPMLAAGAAYGVAAVGGLLLVALPTARGLPIAGYASREVVTLTLLLCAGWGWGTALILKAVTRR